MGFFSRLFGRDQPPRYDPSESYQDNVMVADWSDHVAAPILDDNDEPSASLQLNTPTGDLATSVAQGKLSTRPSVTHGRSSALSSARIPVKKTSVTSDGVPCANDGKPRSSKVKSRSLQRPEPALDSPNGTPQSFNAQGEWTAEEWAAWKAKKKKKSKRKERWTLDQWDGGGWADGSWEQGAGWAEEQRVVRGAITEETAGARKSLKKRKSKKKYVDTEWAA